MQQSQSAGWIYVLTNPSFNDLVKIGKTQRTPQERANELSKATGVPTPFRVFYTRFFEDCHQTEKDIHLYFATQRVANSDREFFRISPVEAVLILDRFFYEEKFKTLENTIQAQQKEIQQLQKINEFVPAMEDFMKEWQMKEVKEEGLEKEKRKLKYIDFEIETMQEYLITLTDENEKIYVTYEIDRLKYEKVKEEKRYFLTIIAHNEQKTTGKKINVIEASKFAIGVQNEKIRRFIRKYFFLAEFHIKSLSKIETQKDLDKKEKTIKLLGYSNNFLYDTYSPKNTNETETNQQVEWLHYELQNINDLERKTILNEKIEVLKMIITPAFLNLEDDKEEIENNIESLGYTIKIVSDPSRKSELEIKIKALKLLIENWD